MFQANRTKIAVFAFLLSFFSAFSAALIFDGQQANAQEEVVGVASFDVASTNSLNPTNTEETTANTFVSFEKLENNVQVGENFTVIGKITSTMPFSYVKGLIIAGSRVHDDLVEFKGIQPRYPPNWQAHANRLKVEQLDFWASHKGFTYDFDFIMTLQALRPGDLNLIAVYIILDGVHFKGTGYHYVGDVVASPTAPDGEIPEQPTDSRIRVYLPHITR